jgi:hypothetical protein
MSTDDIYLAIDVIFASFTRADVHQPSGHGSLNVGEIAPVGVTSILDKLAVTEADVFGDIGSGTGSVLVQVALQTSAQKCVGLEIRSPLAAKSRAVMRDWTDSFDRLAHIIVLTGDIGDDIPRTSELAMCTIILCNNLVFEPLANLGVQSFVCSSSAVHTVVLTERFCSRCHLSCTKEFCKLWMLSETFLVPSCWSKRITIFVFRRRHKGGRSELLDMVDSM